MTRSVALLRGINVAGNRKIQMVDIRAMFEAAGCVDVETYIQSGNVVFSHDALEGTALEHTLEQQVRFDTGFEIAILVRTATELAHVLGANPYPGTEGTKLVVLVLRDLVDPALLEGIDRAHVWPEAFALHGRELYLSLPNGQGRALLPVAIGKCMSHLATTARNWNTVVKLAGLAAR